MQTNPLIIDNQNTIPSKRPGHGKGLGKGLIEEGREQGREGTDFSSTFEEVANEQQSHPGSAGESRIGRKESENGEAESEDLKKDANGGMAKEGKTFGHFLTLDRKAGARSGNERVVRGEELLGSGLKGSLAKLKGINKGTQGLNQADHKTTMDLNKANALKEDLPWFGLERKQGESEFEKVGAKPQGLEKGEGLLHEMGTKTATKGQGTLEAAAKPQGLEKIEGPLHEMGTKTVTKGQGTLEAAAKPQGLEKIEGHLHEMRTKTATKGQRTSEVGAKSQGLEKGEGPLHEMGTKIATKGQETSEAAAKPQGLEKIEGLLYEMGTKIATKGQETLEAAAKPQGLEKIEGILHEMGTKIATKGQGTSEVAVKPQGLEKIEGPLYETGTKSATKSQVILKGAAKLQGLLKDFGEESGRINRGGAQGQEQAVQKLRVGQMKGSPEEFAQKELGTEGSAPRLGIEPKDARSETVKVKVSGGDLTQKKVEKTESNSGENSNLSSKNYSTPDKGTGAISHSKEPHVFTKSSQADTLKQIVNKAAFNLENGRSEFKIDLKPESLGHLKMQILTENHHVTVRILTENPLVKDMIESNLAQLKANFQNQGLEIEKFDVSVAQDSDKNGKGDGKYESKRMREESGDTKNGYGGKAEEPDEVDDLMRRGQQEGAVDFFA